MKFQSLLLVLLAAAIAILAAAAPRAAAVSVAIDDFDDNSLGDMWTQHSQGSGASLVETNDRIEFTLDKEAAGGDFSAGMTHACKLSGDFDVYVNFQLLTWPDDPDPQDEEEYNGHGARVAISAGGYAVERLWGPLFGNSYVTHFPSSGVTTSGTTALSGYLRLAREDSTITGSYGSPAGWTTIMSETGSTDDFSLNLASWSHDDIWADLTVVTSLDSLTLESGTLTCDEKIELTQGIQELQDVPDLLKDLDDGEPPVPIVAERPAYVRVYVEPGTTEEQYTVQVQGPVNSSLRQPLPTNCTQEKQRKQEDNCMSWDFGFVPPTGEWTMTVRVFDDDDQLMSSAELNLRSVETIPITLQPIRVCDSIQSAGPPIQWRCGDRATFAGLVPTARTIYPMEINLPSTIYPRIESPTATDDWTGWWIPLLNELQQRWSDAGGDVTTFFHGYVNSAAGNPVGGGILGGGKTPGHGGATRLPGGISNVTSYTGGTISGSPQVLAHELGHNLGRGHAPVNAAKCYGTPSSLDPGWPNAGNPEIDEVGFDVATGKAMLPEEWPDFMSYCAPPWLSPYTAKALIDITRGTPVSPLSVPQAGEYWSLSGVVNGALELDPMFQLSTTADIGPGEGNYRIEVHGSSGLLFTRMFSTAHAHYADLTGPETFVELIPVQEDADNIMIYGPGNALLQSILLAGEAPEVEITYPAGGEALSGRETVTWTASDSDSSVLTYKVQYSSDGGNTWQTALQTTDMEADLEFAELAGTGSARVRVLATDGVNTGSDTSEPFSVAKHLPEASIMSPLSGHEFSPTALVWLQAYAFDGDDGYLDGTVSWTSSVDGDLGSGDEVFAQELSEGTHQITMTAKDSDDNEVSDSIFIIVGEPSGEEIIWGDNNCSGGADPIDGLLALRHDAGLSVNTGDCPALGEVVEVVSASPHAWGDVDCDDAVTPIDSLKLLRHDAGLSTSQEEDCPTIGATVLVSW